MEAKQTTDVIRESHAMLGHAKAMPAGMVSTTRSTGADDAPGSAAASLVHNRRLILTQKTAVKLTRQTPALKIKVAHAPDTAVRYMTQS